MAAFTGVTDRWAGGLRRGSGTACTTLTTPINRGETGRGVAGGCPEEADAGAAAGGAPIDTDARLDRCPWQEQALQMPRRHCDSGNAATVRARRVACWRATSSRQATMPAVGLRKNWRHAEHSYAHTRPGNTRRRSAAVRLSDTKDRKTAQKHERKEEKTCQRHPTPL